MDYVIISLENGILAFKSGQPMSKALLRFVAPGLAILKANGGGSMLLPHTAR